MRRFCARQGRPSIQLRKRAGFRPKGRGPPTRRRRQPALGNAPTHSSQAQRPGSMPIAIFHSGPQRKTPAPKGARVYRRMGEGLGAGGHSTRRYAFNARASPRFLSLKLFSSLASPRKAPATCARPMRQIGRQVDVSAVGKLQISQTDAKASLFPAAALDHVARADREPAGETVCKRIHETPPGSNATAGNFPAPMSKHRDGSETARRQEQISVDRCGQRSPRPERGSDPELGSSAGQSGLADA
jgi:hypothetical protein